MLFFFVLPIFFETLVCSLLSFCYIVRCLSARLIVLQLSNFPNQPVLFCLSFIGLFICYIIMLAAFQCNLLIQ